MYLELFTTSLKNLKKNQEKLINLKFEINADLNKIL